jgi:O-antigen ligase
MVRILNDTRQQNLLVISLIAIIVWMPLPFGSNQPMYWFYGEVALQVLAALVLGLLAAGRLGVSPAVKFARVPIGIFLIFLVSQLLIHHWPGLQVSADRQATNAQLIKTLCLFQVFCLTLLLVDTERRFKWLVIALLVAGTFQAVYGTLTVLTGTGYIWGYLKISTEGVATGTFINRNHLAGYLEMTLALGLGLMIASLGEGRSRTWRQFFRFWTEALLGEKVRIRVCLVLMVIGLILTRSRMGNTAFFIGMGIAGIIGLFMFRRSQSGVVALLVSIVLIDILLLGTFFGLDELQVRMAQTGIATDSRPNLLMLSVGLLQMAPWFGHGPGAFYAVFPQVRNHEVVGFVSHTHSDWVEFPVELGILGTLPLVALVCLSLTMALRVQLKRQNRFYRGMGFSVTMAMISIGLHSTTDFNLQIFGNAVTFICLMAMPWLAMSLPGRRRGEPEQG